MAYIGNSPGVASQRIVTTLIATAGQTVFVPTSGYFVGYLDVYYKGIKLINGDDYTATNGISVTLTEPAIADDPVELVAYIPRGLSDGYLKSEADSRFLNASGDIVTGVLTFENGTENAVPYLNGSKALSFSGNMSFDGTKLTMTNNPVLSAGTVNGLLYLNGDKAATSGSALTFDGNQLKTLGTGPLFERTTTSTTSVRNTLNLRASSTGTAADGFGPYIEFTLTDLESTASILGGIAAVRNGADNTGKLSFYVSDAGTNSERMSLTSTGLETTKDILVNSIKIGRGAGDVVSNTVLGMQALQTATTIGNNVAIGYQASRNSSSGDACIAIGVFALYDNAGNYNTAIGSGRVGIQRGALGYNTSGISNTAVGFETLLQNTTGNYNTALGQQALAANTTSSENTSIGYQALYSQLAPTVGRNTAVGYASGFSNSTGNQNTFIGAYAGNRMLTGDANVAIGEQALYGAISASGSNNVAIGKSAGSAISSGSENVAVGSLALYSASTSSFNTAIGTNALKSNTTGISNVAIGNNALFSVTTGTRHVAIGRNAGYSIQGGDPTNGALVAIGFEAAKNYIVSGTSTEIYGSIFVGSYAGQAVTTGANNTAIGGFALNTNSTGASNTAIGAGALFLTTGDLNTAIGRSSGGAITTGSKNTILGGFSGNQGGLDIRTANNYIVLSDGDGNPRAYVNNAGHLIVKNRIYQTFEAFSTPGTVNDYVPVVFAWNQGRTITIGRMDVHENEPWRGAGFLKLTYQGFGWGTSAHILIADFTVRPDSSGVSPFGKVERQYSGNDAVIVYLRGSTTFYTDAPIVQNNGSYNDVESLSYNTVTVASLNNGMLYKGRYESHDSLLNNLSPNLIVNRGIAFSATQNPSSDANTLDDYEEGTWTPALGGTTDPTVTYSNLSGAYRKIGKTVWIRFGMRISSISGGSGEAVIRGLPFTSHNFGSYTEPTNVMASGAWVTASLAGNAYAFVYSSNSVIGLRANNNADTTIDFNAFQSGTYLVGNIWYESLD